MFKYYLISPGNRPQYASIAYHIWGDDCDFDSDGNSLEAADGAWTELTIILRPGYQERVDVDPIDDEVPLVLLVRSESAELAMKAARYLHLHSGGTLSEVAPR